MIVKNNKYQKEWHNATKPLKKNQISCFDFIFNPFLFISGLSCLPFVQASFFCLADHAWISEQHSSCILRGHWL
jgi:hypothetical protein